MNIKTKFDISQNVTLKHDREKQPRIVTGISVRANKTISYNLMSGVVDSWHYDFEIEPSEQNEKQKAGFRQ